MNEQYLYKFLDEGLRSHYDGSPWQIGVWRHYEPPTAPCIDDEGLDACPLIPDALSYVRGPILAEVEYAGVVVKTPVFWTCERMRIRRVAQWSVFESVSFGIYSARTALPEWQAARPHDRRPKRAITAAETWLADPSLEHAEAARRAGFEALNAASDATRDAIERKIGWDLSYRPARAAGHAALAAWHAWESLATIDHCREDAADAASEAVDAAQYAAGGLDSVRLDLHNYALHMVQWSDAGLPELAAARAVS